MKQIKEPLLVVIINIVLVLVCVINSNSSLIIIENQNTKKTYKAPLLIEGDKYDLQEGLNIIAIDLGGPENSDRENGAYGDAILLEQNGNYLLMDTGTDDENDVLINYLKTQNINHFSIYLSHCHSDHYGKIKKILKDSYFTVDNIYFPNLDILISKLDNSKDWYEILYPYYNWANNYIKSLNSLGANVILIEEGSSINIGEAKLNVIWDISNSNVNFDLIYNEIKDVDVYKNRCINNTSLVSMIEYKGIKYLTAGDIMLEAEEDILQKELNIKADIFKFSHHGSLNSNTDSFVNKVNPIYAFFPNNYKAGKNSIIWYGDRENGKYQDLVNELTGKTNVLSTLYNGNIIYNISFEGNITTAITRNYHTLTIEYIDIDTENMIENKSIYYFNDRAEYHLEKLDYKKEIDNYVFLYSTYYPNQILSEDSNIICYYKKIGDINGDGKVNIKDWNRLYEHINETAELSEEEFLRADVNNDGKVNIKDWNRLYEHINETNPLW